MPPRTGCPRTCTGTAGVTETWSVIVCAYFACFGPVRTSETDVTGGQRDPCRHPW